MVKCVDDYFKFIKSEWFEFITLIPLGCYIFVFIIWRAVDIVTTPNLLPFYLTVHLYAWLSMVVIIIYNPFKKTFDEMLERRRGYGNGEVRMDPFLCMILIALSLGFATLPFWIVLSRRDKSNLICIAGFFLPTGIMTISCLLFPILFEADIDSTFIIMYGVYFYIFCFLCIYNYMTFCDVSKWMMLINPCTYALAFLVIPFVICMPIINKLLSENKEKEDNKEVDELEDLGILKGVAIDILEYDNKQHEEQENIVSSFNNMIALNIRPDRGPKNQKGVDVCNVCTNVLRQGDILIKTKCSHVYHFQCLKDRYKVYKDCKECREPINMNDV